VADRLGGVAVVGVPSRGPLVQGRRSIRRRPGQLVPEQAAEQVVIPEPPVLVVQRDQEQVGAVDLADISPVPSALPVSASHSGAHMRLRTEVTSRKSRTSAG